MTCNISPDITIVPRKANVVRKARLIAGLFQFYELCISLRWPPDLQKICSLYFGIYNIGDITSFPKIAALNRIVEHRMADTQNDEENQFANPANP